jgi:hypothetical protein
MFKDIIYCDSDISSVLLSVEDIKGVDKIIETLRNWEREFVSYIERTSVGNTECSSVCLHSAVLMQVH